MADLIIRGMEMPKTCHECVFGKYEVCGINLAIEGKDAVTHYCPLIELPPHGRLIDADSLYKQVTKFTGAPHWVAIEIKQAPTIIGAEEG